MRNYDDAVLNVFLEKQEQLFDLPVAETIEEADEFLTDLMAFVAGSLQEVRDYFEEVGTDLESDDLEDLLNLSEVFEIGDGRYLIVEG